MASAIPQADTDGLVVSFADGAASAKLTSGVMALGTGIVSSAAVGSVNAFSSSTGTFTSSGNTYTVISNSYTTVDNFSSGDILDIPNWVTPFVANTLIFRT